ncbi:MAG: hypothetical protein KIT73_04885, partial [Burkholderiales bacterium]|nr:hypothetical protein [Burkholderiales bacterium]
MNEAGWLRWAAIIIGSLSESPDSVGFSGRTSTPNVTPPAPAILLVKTSSLGDVVHNLPVVSDIRRALPGAVVDWAVERSFAALPALHPAVRHVLPCAPRRWRRELLRATTWNEIGALRRRLHATRYDFVIDTQGLLKSA